MRSLEEVRDKLEQAEWTETPLEVAFVAFLQDKTDEFLENNPDRNYTTQELSDEMGLPSHLSHYLEDALRIMTYEGEVETDVRQSKFLGFKFGVNFTYRKA